MNTCIGKEVMGDGLAISSVLPVGTNNTLFLLAKNEERQDRSVSLRGLCVIVNIH